MVNKSKQSPIRSVIERFLKNTTLHGFKYLCSEYTCDRIGWLICCCASACCAGVLCAVFWDRFLQIPALLVMRDLQSVSEPIFNRMPVVAVCPPTESIAELFADKLTTDKDLVKRLPLQLARILEGKSINSDHLKTLEQLLSDNNVSVTDLMYNYMPPCHELIRKCRWHWNMVPCGMLFEKMMTSWGICCVMRPEEKAKSSMQTLEGAATRLDLAFQCTPTNGTTLYGCKFVTKYDGEELLEPAVLTPGYNYIAQSTFTAIFETAAVEKLVQDTCVSVKDYTTSSCLEKCAEEMCGCRDTLRRVELFTNNDLPACTITQLACLRSRLSKNNLTCNCLPPCKKVTSDIILESSPMDFVQYTYDPIYTGLNVTPSIVIHFRVNIGLSTLFTIKPTETWLTLLSSLGGVFNMFMGFGLFSALEILFLIFVQIPKALRKTPNKKNTTLE